MNATLSAELAQQAQRDAAKEARAGRTPALVRLLHRPAAAFGLVVIALFVAMASVACTSNGAKMFGSTWRNAMRHGGLPIARAAST
ncbi:MAG TPA: hypothetical protein VGL52_12905 [Casimicrobiaceae bacterium]